MSSVQTERESWVSCPGSPRSKKLTFSSSSLDVLCRCAQSGQQMTAHCSSGDAAGCWCHSCCVRSGISRLLLLSPLLCTIVLPRAVNTLWRCWGTSTGTRPTWRAPASSCRTQTPTEVSYWAVIVIGEWQNNPLLVRASHPDLRQWGLLWHHPAAAQWRSRGLYLHQKWGVHNQHLR